MRGGRLGAVGALGLGLAVVVVLSRGDPLRETPRTSQSLPPRQGPPGSRARTAAQENPFATPPASQDADASTPEGRASPKEGLFVEGTVFDQHHTPIPDAQIMVSLEDPSLPPGRGLTGPDGSFRLGPLAPGDLDVFVATKFDLRDHPTETKVRLAPGSRPVDIVHPLAPILRGRVVDAEGHPIPGAELDLLRSGPRNPRHGNLLEKDTTTATGDFALRLRTEGALILMVSEPSFQTQRVDIPEPDSREFLQVVLQRGGAVAGTFQDARGVPLEQGTLALWSRTPMRGPVRTTSADETGRFLLAGIPPGHYILEGTLPAESVDRTASLPVEVQDHQRLEVTLQLAEGRSLSGSVVDGAGEALSGACVTATPSAPPEWRQADTSVRIQERPPPDPVCTDAEGRFTLRHLVAESYDLTASLEGHRAPAGPPLRVSTTTTRARIVLERLGQVRGRLVDPQGNPITRFMLNGALQEEAQGTFSLPILETGTLRLTVEAAAQATLFRAVPVHEGRDVDLGTLEMNAGRQVRGRVLDAETLEPLLASVFHTDATLAEAGLFSRVWRSAESAQDGAFMLLDVERRPLVLLVKDGEHLPRRLALDATTDDVTVRLERTARLDLLARDAEGHLLDVEFHFESDDGTAATSGFTSEGRASVQGLAAGGYTVRLYPRSPTPVFFRPRRVEVPASGQATLAFTGEPGGATLRVVVRAEPIRSLWLRPGTTFPISDGATLNQALEGAETGRPGDTGTWVFEHVPPGRVTLIVIPDDVESRFHLESLVLPTEGTTLHEVRPVWRAYRDDDG